MSISRLARTVGTASVVVVVAVPLVAAIAQTQSPPPSPTSPPAATPPPAAPSASPQATTPTPPASEKTAAAVATDLVGLTAKSSDGTNLGAVHSVVTGPGSKVTIGVKVGGFLGFGAHMVAIPDDKFNRIGDTVQVNMTADEINKLPQAKDQK
jgi:PRC-barrel domain protein